MKRENNEALIRMIRLHQALLKTAECIDELDELTNLDSYEIMLLQNLVSKVRLEMNDRILKDAYWLD